MYVYICMQIYNIGMYFDYVILLIKGGTTYTHDKHTTHAHMKSLKHNESDTFKMNHTFIWAHLKRLRRAGLSRVFQLYRTKQTWK